MTKKIFRSIIAVAMIVLLASLVLASSFLYSYFNAVQVSQLKDELSLVASGVEEIGEGYFDDFDSSVFRFTLISENGTVIFDTHTKASEMENHIDREEIKEALKNGSGSDARFSSTIMERTLYEAVRLSNGNVLRISASQMTVEALLLGMIPAVSAIILLAVVVSLILSSQMANAIVKPLNELDLENPSENDVYEELTPILTKINKQHKQITKQLSQLKRKSDEFEQITASMNEGLILLDKKGNVLSINPAARRLFEIENAPVGRDFLYIDQTPEMSRAVEDALSGKHSEFREQRNGGEYQFVINRIESDGNIIGVVILCFNITEIAFAERNRQEFTANVSHELKTPLQSIIGSAELLETGLVKPEDTGRFVANIKNEASRLVSLINDIIRLSQLDEHSEPATESVELYDVACEVIEVLDAPASKRNVTIEFNGESCVINGIRRYLYEIIYNLCDNAIRYNREGGKVIIELKNISGSITLRVSDTGIGIPPEHQARVFERFYRVDKSHSRETGGTGLGLSIVKHAVAYHGGTMKLDSTIGKGTSITITF